MQNKSVIKFFQTCIKTVRKHGYNMRGCLRCGSTATNRFFSFKRSVMYHERVVTFMNSAVTKTRVIHLMVYILHLTLARYTHSSLRLKLEVNVKSTWFGMKKSSIFCILWFWNWYFIPMEVTFLFLIFRENFYVFQIHVCK